MIAALPVIKSGERYYLSPHFGRAPYFAFVEVDGGNYRVLEVVENPHARHERGKGAGVVDLLVSRGANVLIALSMGQGAFAQLRDRGVRVYFTPEVGGRLIALEEAVKMFMNGELSEAEAPRELHGQGIGRGPHQGKHFPAHSV